MKGAMLWLAKVTEEESVWSRNRCNAVRSLFGGSRNPFPYDFRELGYRLPNEERLNYRDASQPRYHCATYRGNYVVRTRQPQSHDRGIS